MIDCAIPSGFKLHFFNKSRYSPPHKYLSGSDINNCLAVFSNEALVSETALPNPPTAECSFYSYNQFFFLEYLLIVSLSIGLIV